MATPDFILFPGPGPDAAAWRIARRDRGAIDWFDAPTIGDVATLLNAHGFAGRPVVLAIRSEDCLAARIATDGLPRADCKALLYRLEDKLPVAAEAVVADFIPFDASTAGGAGALGVCVQLDRVRPIVDAIESAGVPVQSIVPAALAVAQMLAQTLAATPGDADVVLLIAEPSTTILSLVAIRAGRAIDWAYLPADVEDVKLHLALLGSEFASTPRVIAAGLPASTTDALTERLGLAVTVHVTPVANDAAAFCTAALAGDAMPWIDFRRDALATADRFRQLRRPVNALLGTVAIVLAITTLALLVLASRYARVEADLHAQMVADFRAQFPDWAMPSNVRAVVESEHRRVAAATSGVVATSASSAGAGAWYGSAFTSFRDVLVALPTDGRYAIERMSFADASFELAGRLQSYDQVDAIATAARRSGMSVAPPQTRRDARGTWTFSLQGTRPTEVGGTR